ncbi:hypothetical protein ATEIFO6365_0002072400 [Aspergillus terreus]|uniref:Uncharacterized protein n=1 Tax=Aspergillus terreus TaxID=33178 RepID=A0A5M3Z6Q3_ASPTE|nr:hypothetical protein ATETN484_0008032200 [Aspergillus terreus]GFF13613.1 hypothetical protein ATEIFO6365_0002072400 [Aspergillus terreus]
MSDYNATDLNSVLQTLSAFSHQQSQSQPQSQYQPSPTEPPKDTNINDDSLTPPSSQSLPRPRPTPPQSQSHSQPQDTSSITTWPAALQHVMRAMSQNEDLQRRIRRLIQRQHDHERQWWQGREALCAKQRARGEKKKELDAVLRSVGAPVDDSQVSTAEEDKAELQNYDAKVYRASRQMADAMAAELRALRIPFFTVKPGAGGLTAEALATLQRRMLELLQDLCGE